MALLDRFSGRIPTLVVETTDEHWQLRRELGGLLNRQPVTQRMQRCPESQIGLVPIWAVQNLHQILEPHIGLMYRPVENFEACRTHHILSFKSPGSGSRNAYLWLYGPADTPPSRD